MKKTSFGNMSVLLEQHNIPEVEYLIFENEGRPHKHQKFESFFVLSGSGVVYISDECIPVVEGNLVCIPPKLIHWMSPDPGVLMRGLLWYHEQPLSQKET